MSFLIATDDNGQDVTISLEEPVEIGRAEDSTMVVVRKKNEVVTLGIEDNTVSRKHARIYWEFGRLTLRDLGSKNGTRLRNAYLPGWEPGKRSEPVEIEETLHIQFGLNTIIRVERGIPTLQKEPTITKGTKIPFHSFRVILDIRDK